MPLSDSFESDASIQHIDHSDQVEAQIPNPSPVSPSLRPWHQLVSWVERHDSQRYLVCISSSASLVELQPGKEDETSFSEAPAVERKVETA
jgi:hypothetical protein